MADLPKIDPKVEQLVTDCAMTLRELYEPAGVLLFWSARITYLDNRRPADLVAARDIEGLETLLQRLEALADGAFL